jgi:peptide/nickel transport system substrate-binding protein
MKRLALLAAIGLMAAAPAFAQETPRRGGTLNFAIAFEPPTYDCHAATTFAVLHAVAPHYSTLLKFDLARYPNVTGDLAESWTVSPDGKTYTFRLRENVRFHDGSPLSSADVKASYERIMNPPQGVVSVRRGELADVASIETPDPRTIVFRLREVNASMLGFFASPWNCVYSAAKLREDANFPARNILGTGAFRFGEHIRGSHWTGARFDGYFRPGLPHLDGFRAVFMAQTSAIANALQGGAIHADFRGFTPADRERLEAAMGNRVRFEAADEMVHLIVSFNTEKAPFSDVRVRQALSLAIDRWGGSQGFRRTSRLSTVGGMFRPGSPSAASEAELTAIPGFGRDVAASRAQARRLLQEAGVSNLSFVLNNRNQPPYTEAGVYLVDQWRQIGVTVEHRQTEIAQWSSALTSGNFDVIVDFGNDYVDDPALAPVKYLSFDKSPTNGSRAIDRTLDSLYERQMRAGDPAQRRALLREFETRALTQAYNVPVLWVQRIIALNADVRGWRISPSNSLGQDLAEVWLAR